MVASELLLVLSIGSCAVCSASQTTASTFVIPVAFNFRHFLQFVRFFPFFPLFLLLSDSSWIDVSEFDSHFSFTVIISRIGR